MKKILLILACTPLAMFGMDKEKPSQNVVKFLTMEQQHKLDWLNYKKDKYDAKIELIKNHLNQMIALKMKGLDELGKGMDIQTYMKDCLKPWIKLHEEQTKKWKDLCELWHKKGLDIAASHKKELDSFKASLYPEERPARVGKELGVVE